MTTELQNTHPYQQLVSDLKDLMVQGQQAALNAVNELRIKTYWEMGRRMAELKELADPAQAGTLVARLSQDLGIDSTLVYRIMQLYRLWPKAIPHAKQAPQLSWTHYVELLSLKDGKERDYYLQTAASEEWGPLKSGGPLN